jgi:heterodisulfide reductase subunit A
MDIRTFGKGYEQFYRTAQAMGIEFVKAKVAKITEDNDHNPIFRVEVVEEGSKIIERKHDLAVLSVGMLPGYNPLETYGVSVAEDGFIACPSPNIAPTTTNQSGIFATGTAIGPMDIVDSIIMAGAAASEAAAYLEGLRCGDTEALEHVSLVETKELVHA